VGKRAVINFSSGEIQATVLSPRDPARKESVRENWRRYGRDDSFLIRSFAVREVGSKPNSFCFDPLVVLEIES
jgi:hypothetical protein